MKTQYRKIDGAVTTSAKEYAKSYRRVARPIEKATNSRVFAYDPGLSFFRLDNRQSVWDLDGKEAVIFANALLELEELKKEKKS